MKKKKLKKEIAELRREIKDLQTKVQALERGHMGAPVPLGASSEEEMCKRIVRAYMQDKNPARTAALSAILNMAATNEAEK